MNITFTVNNNNSNNNDDNNNINNNKMFCWMVHLITDESGVIARNFRQKWSLSFRISSVNMTKFAGNCRFVHNYNREP